MKQQTSKRQLHEAADRRWNPRPFPGPHLQKPKKKDNFSLFTIFFLRKDIHTFSFFEINKSKRGNFSSSLMGSSGYLTRPKRCQFGFPFFFFLFLHFIAVYYVRLGFRRMHYDCDCFQTDSSGSATRTAAAGVPAGNQSHPIRRRPLSLPPPSSLAIWVNHG